MLIILHICLSSAQISQIYKGCTHLLFNYQMFTFVSTFPIYLNLHPQISEGDQNLSIMIQISDNIFFQSVSLTQSLAYQEPELPLSLRNNQLILFGNHYRKEVKE